MTNCKMREIEISVKTSTRKKVGKVLYQEKDPLLRAINF